MPYPDVTQPHAQEEIRKKFKKYTIPKDISKKSIKELCKPPTRFSLQYPQKFLSEFMSPKSPYKGILIFHQIGSGKTCTAISICEQWKQKRKLVVIMPASLIGNFRDELRSPCGNNNYMTSRERQLLSTLNDQEQKQLLHRTDERIDRVYTLLSYNKFVDMIDSKSIRLTNTLLVIDEVQNIVSEHGSYYKKIKLFIEKAPKDLRIVLLSATPLFDKPAEIGLTMNLLPLHTPFPVYQNFNDMFIHATTTSKSKLTQLYTFVNKADFVHRIRGFISYYRGMPPQTFPKHDFKIVRCVMHPFQLRAYNTVIESEHYITTVDLLNLPNNFFLGGRLISNIVFPNLKPGDKGIVSLKPSHLEINELKKYSCKFYRIIKKIKKSPGKIFFYSAFLGSGGIESFIMVLQANGFKNFKDMDTKDKKTQKYFSVWSGNETSEYKEHIKHVFNQQDSPLTIMLGSPAIKEGVSFKRVRQVHILEPYWNLARLQQVIGRAIRYCSHADLPKEEQQVTTYLYLAIRPNESEFRHKSNILDRMSIDRYIYHIALEKQKLNTQFEEVMKQTAIDCELNRNLNRVVCSDHET